MSTLKYRPLNFLKFLVLFFIFHTDVLGSDYYWLRTATKEWKKSGRKYFLDGMVNEGVLDSLDLIYTNNPNRYFFFLNGLELQAYVSCGFDLYAVEDGALDQNYKYFNRGYTCGTTPFVVDSTNYLIGGNGFWSAHIDLLWFDEIHGSWELVNTKNQPLDYFICRHLS